MALERKIDESALLIFQDSNGAERPECVMLDPGASAFLSGYGPFRRYLDHLITLDFPIEVIKMSKGRRRFQFGGDASMWSDWSAHIPTFVDGKYGTIELFLLPGNTPMLCGRPIIEALGMTMDFAQRRLRIGSSPSMPATLGRQGEYLWSFTNEYLNINYDPERPEFVLRTNDQGIEQDDDYKLNDFMLAESGFTAFEKADLVDEEKTKPLRRHELKTMDVHLTTQLNDLSAYVTKELHQPERPRLLWEVYCGKARTAQVAASLGMEVRCFSYDTGWDFEQLKHQDEFLALLEDEAPDELLIAPECKLWSRTESFGRRTPAQKEALKAARHRHHERHLTFTRRNYLCQVKGGRYATIEQPKHAFSWHGAQCLDDDGIWKPVQKNTTFLTTKQAVQDAFTLQCQHDHEHCLLEGAAPGYGSRTRYLEEYQPALAATLQWEIGHAAEDEKETTSSLIRLRSHTKQDAIRTVQRLHRNLGLHWSNCWNLVVLPKPSCKLQDRTDVLPVPNTRSHRKLHQLLCPLNFNDVLQADVMWLRRGTIKYAIMNLVDSDDALHCSSVDQLRAHRQPHKGT